MSARYGEAKARGTAAEADWNTLFASYAAAFPELAAELKRRIAGELPANWQSVVPRFTPKDAPQATRYDVVYRLARDQRRAGRAASVSPSAPSSVARSGAADSMAARPANFRKRC